ncbi:MAG TPA: hypothetical protein VLM89_00755, partial [Phycisphaerae bacterium]|nr:hypothetical protein [Phycisphaerae bacterium]
EESATVEVTRADWPADRRERVTFTAANAVTAGLMALDAGGRNISRKDNWRKYCSDMLLARARGTAIRRWLEETVAGLPYSPDEIGAETDEDGQIIELDQAAGSSTPAWSQQVAKPAPAAVDATSPPPPADTAVASALRPVPSWGKASMPPVASIPEPVLDPVRESLGEIFATCTPEQVERAKELVRRLSIDAAAWRALCIREAGVPSIRDMSQEAAGRMLTRLDMVWQVRLLREACNLSSESWTKALCKRSVKSDLELSAEAMGEIRAKLSEQVTPFERQKLGIDLVQEGTIAGKGLPPTQAA